MATARQLVQRWNELRTQRRYYESLWQDIAAFVSPTKANITRTLAPGAKQTQQIFDSTAIQGVGLLAANMYANITPSTQPWLSLALRDEALNTEPTVRDWLEDCSRRMHKALRQSNFATAVHEMFLDMVGPAATGSLFVDERPLDKSGTFAGLLFRAHPPGEYAVAEDAEGRVDTFFRLLKMTARVAYAKWGDAVGDVLKEKAEKKPDEKIEILHAVYPRGEIAYAGGKPKRGAQNLPWASCYVSLSPERKLEEGGYHEFPFMVPRWSKASDEVYGRGPSHTAYPDVRSLNAAKEFVLKAAPLAMQPPTLERNDAVVGDLDLTPGGRNVVDANGPIGDYLAFLDTKNRPDLSHIVVADLRQAIMEAYFIPQLHLKDSPQMTATEVQARVDEFLRFLGPVQARVEAEFLNPLVQRLFGIMARAQALLPMPDALQQVAASADLDVEYEGPLARVQRTQELVAQDRVVTFVANIVQTSGKIDLWDNLDLDKMIRDRVEITGMRGDELHDDQTMQQLRDARARQQQQAQALQVAETAGKAAPALTAIHNAAQRPQGAAA